MSSLSLSIKVSVFLVLVCARLVAQDSAFLKSVSQPDQLKFFVNEFCIDCHDEETKTAGLSFVGLLKPELGKNAKVWESVIRKLESRQMPPSDMPRPDERQYKQAQVFLESALDAFSKSNPNPGRTESLRRLTRAEYQNAIRDLLHIEIDASKLLPADESSHGFDNIIVTGLSPTLMSRYISAAQKISRLAVGNLDEGSISENFRMRPDVTQDLHRVKGLPLGTRGGMLIPFDFPKDGQYEIRIRLMRDRNDEIEALRGKHELEVLFDRRLAKRFVIEKPPRGKSDKIVEAQLHTRLDVKAGRHDVGVTFVKKPFALIESESQPLNVHYNFYRHPRLGPAVYQVTISGPFRSESVGNSPSRKQIFTSSPSSPREELDCAKQILSRLMRLAYRRPVSDLDLKTPLKFFERGSQEGGFDLGIQRALSAILINPNFLFRIERQPKNSFAGRPYKISDLELASRMSFFIWNSLPDEELIQLAEKKRLHEPEILENQVRRMLADSRSKSLVTNFADQWLYLRNLESFVPDARLYPDFGQNLRSAFRRETELLFQEIIEKDKSVLLLLNSRYTYLNERLAKHYGIPHVYGSHFRRVELDKDSHRGGILQHGSILSVTSYATRTSPVLRGNWVLENILGSPTPPPPPDVPALEDTKVDADLPVRKRLAIHRENIACASCHDLIDPIGFAFEHYDAVGRYRVMDKGDTVDSKGGLPDGSRFDGVGGLEAALLKRPRLFVRTMTEKLMIYALGRGIEFNDAPAIRKIVRDAERNDYGFSALIVGIVKSDPFTMRTAE